MKGTPGHARSIFSTCRLSCAVFAISMPVATAAIPNPTDDGLWRETVAGVSRGDFKGAAGAIRKLHAEGPLVEQVRKWLDEYEAEQEARRAIDREDFERFVGYAKARVERKEYWRALSWATRALDCAADREAFLQTPWLLDLVNASLEKAQAYRKDSDWRNAWSIYARLSVLYENEPRYQKLERQAGTHLRLNAMFREKNPWEENIEKVRWSDAEKALNYIGMYYVEEADFRLIAERGLEQLLYLAESKTAQERVKGLQNEDDRNDFESRISRRLEQIRSAARVDRRTCVEHFRRVVHKINAQTVRLPEPLIVSELMRGALEPLDDFTTVIWPRASKEFEKHTRGDFPGVGISIIKNKNDEIEVVSPLEDTPAYRAGIQAGDVITDVDGKSLKGFSVNKVVETITGPEGTAVTLTIRRNDKSIDFPLTRARVRIRSVKGVRRDPRDEERWDHWLDRQRGIGYVRVTNFQSNTVEDTENALAELRGLKGLVLDLRGNPGGLLNAAWKMASLFLGRDEAVVSTRGRHKSEDQSFPALSEGPYAGIPLVVLVDERSASASEIVSGAIRDNRRGTVIGERTFGKFSVQNLIPLGASGAKLKITTARYYLPSGDSLHRTPTAKTWGVTPDIPVHLVQWEAYNVYQMQREANLLGPAKPDVDSNVAGADEASKNKPEDLTDAGTPSGDDKQDTDGETKPAGDDKNGEGNVLAKDVKPSGDAKDAEKAKEHGDAEKVADADEEEKLPPLEQPDENNRPKKDPQLDTALLLLRIQLLAETHPTLAAAERAENKEAVRP